MCRYVNLKKDVDGGVRHEACGFFLVEHLDNESGSSVTTDVGCVVRFRHVISNMFLGVMVQAPKDTAGIARLVSRGEFQNDPQGFTDCTCFRIIPRTSSGGVPRAVRYGMSDRYRVYHPHTSMHLFGTDDPIHYIDPVEVSKGTFENAEDDEQLVLCARKVDLLVVAEHVAASSLYLSFQMVKEDDKDDANKLLAALKILKRTKHVIKSLYHNAVDATLIRKTFQQREAEYSSTISFCRTVCDGIKHFLEDKDDDDDVAEWQQDVYKRQGLLQDTGALGLMVDIISDPIAEMSSGTLQAIHQHGGFLPIANLWESVMAALDVSAEGSLTSTDAVLKQRKCLLSLLRHTMYLETENAKEVVTELFGDNRDVLDDLFADITDLASSYSPTQHTGAGIGFGARSTLVPGIGQIVVHGSGELDGDGDGGAKRRHTLTTGSIVFSQESVTSMLPNGDSGEATASRGRPSVADAAGAARDGSSLLGFDDGAVVRNKAQQASLRVAKTLDGHPNLFSWFLKFLRDDAGTSHRFVTSDYYDVLSETCSCKGKSVGRAQDPISEIFKPIQSVLDSIQEAYPGLQGAEANQAVHTAMQSTPLFKSGKLFLFRVDSGGVPLVLRGSPLAPDGIEIYRYVGPNVGGAPKSQPEMPPAVEELLLAQMRLMARICDGDALHNAEAYAGKRITDFRVLATLMYPADVLLAVIRSNSVPRLLRARLVDMLYEIHASTKGEAVLTARDKLVYVIGAESGIVKQKRQSLVQGSTEQNLKGDFLAYVLGTGNVGKNSAGDTFAQFVSEWVTEMQACIHAEANATKEKKLYHFDSSQFNHDLHEGGGQFIISVLNLIEFYQRRGFLKVQGKDQSPTEARLMKMLLSSILQQNLPTMEVEVEGEADVHRNTMVSEIQCKTLHIVESFIDHSEQVFADLVVAKFEASLASPSALSLSSTKGVITDAQKTSRLDVALMANTHGIGADHSSLEDTLLYTARQGSAKLCRESIAVLNRTFERTDRAMDILRGVCLVNENEPGFQIHKRLQTYLAEVERVLIATQIDDDESKVLSESLAAISHLMVVAVPAAPHQSTVRYSLAAPSRHFQDLLRANQGFSIAFDLLDQDFDDEDIARGMEYPLGDPARKAVVDALQQCFLMLIQGNDCHYNASQKIFVELNNLLRKPPLRTPAITPFVATLFSQCFDFDTHAEDVTKRHIANICDLYLEQMATPVCVAPEAPHVLFPSAELIQLMTRMACPLFGDVDNYARITGRPTFVAGKDGLDFLEQNPDDRNIDLIYEVCFGTNEDDRAKMLWLFTMKRDNDVVDVTTANFLRLQFGTQRFHPTAAIMCHIALVNMINMMMTCNECEHFRAIQQLSRGRLRPFQADSLWFLSHCGATGMSHNHLLLSRAKAAHIDFVRTHARSSLDDTAITGNRLSFIADTCITEVTTAIAYLADKTEGGGDPFAKLLVYTVHNQSDTRWDHVCRSRDESSSEENEASAMAFLKYALGSALPFLVDLVSESTVSWASLRITEQSHAALYTALCSFTKHFRTWQTQLQLQAPREGASPEHFTLWKVLILAEECVDDVMHDIFQTQFHLFGPLSTDKLISKSVHESFLNLKTGLRRSLPETKESRWDIRHYLDIVMSTYGTGSNSKVDPCLSMMQGERQALTDNYMNFFHMCYDVVYGNHQALLKEETLGTGTIFTEYSVLDSKDDDDIEFELHLSDEFQSKVAFWCGFGSSPYRTMKKQFAVLDRYLAILEDRLNQEGVLEDQEIEESEANTKRAINIARGVLLLYPDDSEARDALIDEAKILEHIVSLVVCKTDESVNRVAINLLAELLRGDDVVVQDKLADVLERYLKNEDPRTELFFQNVHDLLERYMDSIDVPVDSLKANLIGDKHEYKYVS